MFISLQSSTNTPPTEMNVGNRHFNRAIVLKQSVCRKAASVIIVTIASNLFQRSTLADEGGCGTPPVHVMYSSYDAHSILLHHRL